MDESECPCCGKAMLVDSGGGSLDLPEVYQCPLACGGCGFTETREALDALRARREVAVAGARLDGYRHGFKVGKAAAAYAVRDARIDGYRVVS